MCVYVHVCIYIYIYVCVYTYIYMYVYVYLYIYVYVYIYIYIHTHACVYIYIHNSVDMYHVGIIHIYIYIYIHICIHTHIMIDILRLQPPRCRPPGRFLPRPPQGHHPLAWRALLGTRRRVKRRASLFHGTLLGLDERETKRTTAMCYSLLSFFFGGGVTLRQLVKLMGGILPMELHVLGLPQKPSLQNSKILLASSMTGKAPCMNETRQQGLYKPSQESMGSGRS